ncbi:hypothetical protein MMC30_003970 [Trapelia coarctata]|nr:hypothetical protein [Trapelia coarctata]
MAPISANSHNEGFISLAVKENVGQEGVPAIPPRESMQAISPDRPVAGPLTGKPDEICDLEKDTPAVRTGDITSVTINPEQSSAVCSPPPINASGTQSESSAADIRTTRGRESILEAGINILITRTEDQQSQQFALPHAGILQQTYDDDPFSSATGFGASLAILLVCLIAGLGLSECWLSVIGFTLIPAYQSWTILGMAGLLLFISGIPSWE